jgi:hypothetical protein
MHDYSLLEDDELEQMLTLISVMAERKQKKLAEATR